MMGRKQIWKRMLAQKGTETKEREEPWMVQERVVLQVKVGIVKPHPL